MNLSARERRTIVIGAAAVVVILGYLWGIRPLVRAVRRSRPTTIDQRGRFADARTRIIRYASAAREISSLSENLHVEIPTESPSDQMKQLVEQFEQLSGRARVKINNIQQLKSRARKGATPGMSRTELRLDLTAESFACVVRFIDSLEEATVPIVLDQISITTSGGRGGSAQRGPAPSGPPGAPPGSGGPPGRSSSNRQIQAAMKIHTYLFPERAQR